LFIDQFDAYIVVSFTNATLVLSIGDTVEEVLDTGFLTSEPTIDVQQVGEDALVQVSCIFTSTDRPDLRLIDLRQWHPVHFGR
jgi:hypothetical protein